ncbi:GPI inositol-deacylase [Glycine soja]|uniref:GPI inositol-deacylase n=1 Tax=Glycine soja TaxID=3848 RepID=A0A445FDU8_GLYSO|nr:GPI inositol-deacylase [Glycine soja]
MAPHNRLLLDISNPIPVPSPLLVIGENPNPNSYPINLNITRQNRDGFERYPRLRVLLSCLVKPRVCELKYLSVISEICSDLRTLELKLRLRMPGFRGKIRIGILIIVVVGICLAALYGLLKPISNGCIMTYMYPTYIPISSSESISPVKYGLYLYHEGWKKIDFKEHLKKLSGVPVLFIPGNGGSFKQARSSFFLFRFSQSCFVFMVRSLAAESDRAYQNGPLERTFYQEASLRPEEGGVDINLSGFQLPSQYTSRLDWFAVDLEGEHSAMDGAILEEHTEYVVYAIHKILDQYKVSYDARTREGAAVSGSLPKSVILVGHSMGGFVARAAVIHPHLRKSAVETVLTLSSPHQSPPVALQPSLGRYFARVNSEWIEGYKVQTTNTGHYVSDPVLSHVVVVSISGAYNDYQVRSKLTSLDNIVPPTHGFMIGSTAMKNVWLSMEHQAILWCNQLVVQVSHTLLSLIDSRTGQPFPDTQKRLAVFARMLRSGISHNFDWMMQLPSYKRSLNIPAQNTKDVTGSLVHRPVACPANIHWNDGGLDRDLYIQINELTVLAMDGRRRWLDIQKLIVGPGYSWAFGSVTYVSNGQQSHEEVLKVYMRRKG